MHASHAPNYTYNKMYLGFSSYAPAGPSGFLEASSEGTALPSPVVIHAGSVESVEIWWVRRDTQRTTAPRLEWIRHITTSMEYFECSHFKVWSHCSLWSTMDILHASFLQRNAAAQTKHKSSTPRIYINITAIYLNAPWPTSASACHIT